MSNTTNTITIYGASDDLVEVEGPFGDEFGCYDRAMTLAFDDGTKVRVAYSEAGDGCWRVEVIALGEGAEVVEHFKATDGDSNDYSDKLTLRGSFTKIVRKTKSALKTIEPLAEPAREREFTVYGAVGATAHCVVMARSKAEARRIAESGDAEWHIEVNDCSPYEITEVVDSAKQERKP